MKIVRIHNPDQLMVYWPELLKCFIELKVKAKEDWTAQNAFLRCCSVMALEDSGYLAVGLTDADTFVNFVVGQKVHTAFGDSVACIYACYYEPGRLHFAQHMQTAFEEWCRQQHITKYFTLTRRDTGAARVCFHRKFGMNCTGLIFEKEVI